MLQDLNLKMYSLEESLVARFQNNPRFLTYTSGISQN